MTTWDDRDKIGTESDWSWTGFLVALVFAVVVVALIYVQAVVL